MNDKSHQSVEDISCPTCGYYCLGHGGVGCIDKPAIMNVERTKDAEKERLYEQKLKLFLVFMFFIALAGELNFGFRMLAECKEIL